MLAKQTLVLSFLNCLLDSYLELAGLDDLSPSDFLPEKRAMAVDMLSTALRAGAVISAAEFRKRGFLLK